MSKYVEYEYDDGKFAKIPLDEIERIMQLDGVKTQDDACWIWCEDNGKVINEEQEELCRKAKENKITATIHQAREKAPTKRKVERKTDETKESIIKALADMLADMVENVQVTNIGKLIEFDLKGEHYKLDLVRQRKPKAKG